MLMQRDLKRGFCSEDYEEKFEEEINLGKIKQDSNGQLCFFRGSIYESVCQTNKWSCENHTLDP